MHRSYSSLRIEVDLILGGLVFTPRFVSKQYLFLLEKSPVSSGRVKSVWSDLTIYIFLNPMRPWD